MLLAESLTEQVIGPAIEVHRNTGPGLLEAVYEQCLCVELRRAAVAFARQVSIPMLYKGAQVGDGFKADIVVDGHLILEIKSVATILALHEMQLRTYLRMSGIRIGLLLNLPLTISGTSSGQLVNDEASVAPFYGVTIADPNVGQTETLTVTMAAAANGTLSNLGSGNYNAATGVYTDTGSAAAVTAALGGLIFTPTPNDVSRPSQTWGENKGGKSTRPWSISLSPRSARSAARASGCEAPQV